MIVIVAFGAVCLCVIASDATACYTATPYTTTHYFFAGHILVLMQFLPTHVHCRLSYDFCGC
jgi:hypothetical protein